MVPHLAAVVVKDRRDVFFGKRSGGVRDEEAGFSHGTVAHNDTLYSLHDDL